MKKKIFLIVSGCLVALSLSVCGVAFAVELGLIVLPSGSELGYNSTDQANLTLYNDSIVYPTYTFEAKPEDLIKSLTDIDGNEVDFSELEISYGYVRRKNDSPIPLTENEALNSDGFLYLEKYGTMSVTFTYTYDTKTPSNYSATGTIKKTAFVEEAAW